MAHTVPKSFVKLHTTVTWYVLTVKLHDIPLTTHVVRETCFLSLKKVKILQSEKGVNSILITTLNFVFDHLLKKIELIP